MTSWSDGLCLRLVFYLISCLKVIQGMLEKHAATASSLKISILPESSRDPHDAVSGLLDVLKVKEGEVPP